MVRITIDGKALDVEPGKTIIQAAHEAGITIPYYCYHPGMVVDGNCRICLVEIEKQPKLAVACKTPVAEGMVIHTGSPKVHEGRRHVLEFLLIHHPLDCPVCDQAGECKLQDYYYDYDLARSRFKDQKNKKPKVVPLGPYVMFDAERCILCSRCVRFTRDITETNELLISGRGDRSVISLAPGKTLDNPYSMNVVDICPVGALTSRDFRFKKRVWFLETKNGICPGCSRGCSIHIDYDPRENRIYRIRPRKNLWVNQYWMCDDGRFTYRRTTDHRLRTPYVEGKEKDWKTALGTASRLWNDSIRTGKRIGIILSPSMTLEELYAIRLLTEGMNSIEFLLGEDYTPEDGYSVVEDDFLIEGDKHPNRKGVELLFGNSLSEVKDLQGFDFLLIFGRALRKISQDPLPPAIVLTPVFDPFIPRISVALPGRTHFEKSGSFVNSQGILQGFQKVLYTDSQAPGELEIIAELGKVSGVSIPQTTEEIFDLLSHTLPRLNGLTFSDLLKRKAIPVLEEAPLWIS
jgi:NADH-quinone oxidoreductase subunit G